VIGSSNPTARLALRPTRAAALEVDVTAVTNSSSQPIAVELTLEVDDGVRLQRFDVGHAALFPPDQPARFVLPLPAMAATALGVGVRIESDWIGLDWIGGANRPLAGWPSIPGSCET